MRDLTDFEINIYNGFKPVANKCNSFVNYLKLQIENGTLPIGFILPPIEQLADANRLSISTVSRALAKLAEQNYVILKQGAAIKVSHPSSAFLDKSIKTDRKLIFNDTCMWIGSLNKSFHDDYFRIIKAHYEETQPNLQSSSYEPLNITLCEQTNVGQGTSHLYPSFNYLHGEAALLRVIALAISKPAGVTIIPKNMPIELKDALSNSHTTLIEINSDAGGLSMKELTKACSENDVNAVYLMPEFNFPDTRSMSKRRIEHIIEAQKEWGFYIIADDRFKFWNSLQKSLFLRLSKKIADKVIYLRPLSNHHPDLQRTKLVIAKPTLINKIRELASEGNHQFYYSNAFAINLLLNRKSYDLQVAAILSALKDLKVLVYNIFSESAVWKEYGIRVDSGAAIYLEPKQGKFSADAYASLVAEQIYVVDPSSYLKENESIAGLRLELTHLIGLKNIEHHLKKVNKVLVSLIEPDK